MTLCQLAARSIFTLGCCLPLTGAAETWGSLSEYYQSLNQRCETAQDCEVKNVGNCCGKLPRCVNRDAKPDLAAVEALCAAQDTMSVCGFQPIAFCLCVSGRCEAPESASVLPEVQ